MKIVIADDSSLMRDRVKSLLINIDKDSEVYEAENGLEALELISSQNPHLAILDIRMPEMSGIDVLKRIRELKLKVKVCILTNYPYPQYKKRCLEEGAEYFLDKNLDAFRINEIISELTERNSDLK